MKKLYILNLIILCITINISAQQTPAPIQTTDFSIEGATAHIGNGQLIENSLVMFSKGKITFVGSASEKISRIGTIIKAEGKHIYPGFIIANSTLGLGEIDAVRATLDADEVGTFLPHVRSLIAYNTESRVIESMRPNGVLMGQITPRGGVISGTSSIVQFDAWNWEDAAIKVDEGIHLNWPKSFTRKRAWMGEGSGMEPNKKYTENIESIKTFMLNGKNYFKGKRYPQNLPYEALEGLFNNTQNLYIHASTVKEITDAIAFSKKIGISKLVIVHGNEAYKIADLLIENNIPVIIERPHRLPDNEDDDYNLPYKTAKLLVDKGITVAIGMEGDMERMSARNLPFYAGTCAAYGIDKEQALKLITSNPAKILGIDAIVGTLEVGKDATLFISEGDALDMRTNKLTDAFIQGRKISLESHQTTLWKRYSKKYSSQ
ncbi:amidohydrolase family protein [Lutibacter sp. B1]|uniref:amidohydrolase family protein n=1 Tax=Lutibacter sp. B1 TaxID=2725996 RepID=UPI0014568250|nr:amidohydrolase family protein [Lutibacter sp. B1]NLP58770.1 amidohydrolase family protein [Lutibacter sp. B1]